MSITYGFYNSLNGDRTYDAIQMSSIFDGIIKDGIFMSIGQCMVVKANSGLMVNVTPGRAWFDHTWTLVDANYLVRWEAAEGEEYPTDLDGNDVTPETVMDRIDAVILRVNSEASVRANFIGIKKGTPTTEDPQKPTLTNTDTIHEYALAYVTIGHGITEITQSVIENAVGTDNTPYITGILDTVDIDDLVAQWGDQWKQWYKTETSTGESNWNNWFNTETSTGESNWDNWFNTETTKDEAAWNAWYPARQAAFESWFTNLQDQLDTEQAAHLQNEIDNIIPITDDEIDTIWNS